MRDEHRTEARYDSKMVCFIPAEAADWRELRGNCCLGGKDSAGPDVMRGRWCETSV